MLPTTLIITHQAKKPLGNMRLIRSMSLLFDARWVGLSNSLRKLPFSVQVHPALAITSITLSSGFSSVFPPMADISSILGTGYASSQLFFNGCLSVTARTGILGSAVVLSCSFIADGMRLIVLSCCQGERDLERSLCSLNCFRICSTRLSLLLVLFFYSILRMISFVLAPSSTWFHFDRSDLSTKVRPFLPTFPL